MLSYWEKQSLLNYDVIIVGAGIVGLSTAISIKERAQHQRVLVLERALLPTGASTKNAGFACIGSLTEIIDDLKTMTETMVLELVELRLKGLKKLRSRLSDQKIAYAENGSWELISGNQNELAAPDKVDYINEKLRPVLGGAAFEISAYSGHKAEFGFSDSHVQYLVKNNYEGELDTGKMMRCLIDMCFSLGVEIKTGCNVCRLEESNHEVNVVVDDPLLREELVFCAGQLCICTNAHAGQFYPELDIQPGRGHVLITRPIADLRFRGIYHFDRGYYYFRRLGDRVLLGGGRNLDFERERTTDLSFNEKIQKDLTDRLRDMIIPGHTFEIEQWWTGTMAFGASKFPILKRQTDRICLGVRLGGMGVAMGSEIGENLAAMVLE